MHTARTASSIQCDAKAGLASAPASAQTLREAPFPPKTAFPDSACGRGWGKLDCRFVEDGRPPENGVLNQSEHCRARQGPNVATRTCTETAWMLQPARLSLAFPKLKCPPAVSGAEISAADVIMRAHAQDRPNVPAHILRRS